MFIRLSLLLCVCVCTSASVCSLCCLFVQRLQLTNDWIANGIQSRLYIELHILNILQNGWKALTNLNERMNERTDEQTKVHNVNMAYRIEAIHTFKHMSIVKVNEARQKGFCSRAQTHDTKSKNDGRCLLVSCSVGLVVCIWLELYLSSIACFTIVRKDKAISAIECREKGYNM